jgi:DNA-binding transcriptional LysR family regulator
MELRHLRYFLAVAEEGHLTRAAERLGIQQPPLSQQIRALESELEVQLFRRKPRGMELTEAGRTLFEQARAVFVHIDQALATTRRTARGEEGRIAVGFTNSTPFHPFVPRTIRAFREAYPRVAFVLDEGATSELIDALESGAIDAAFIRSPARDIPMLTVEALLEEDLVVALPTTHRLATMDDVALKALAGETFILYRRPVGPGLYDTIIGACQRAGFSPQVGQEAPRIVSTLNLVAAGLGVSIVPASMQRLTMDGVAYRRLKGVQLPKAPLNIAYRRSDTSAALHRFVAQVRQQAQSDSAHE